MTLNDDKNEQILKSKNMEFRFFAIWFLLAAAVTFGIIYIQFLIPRELLIEANVISPYLTRIYIILGGVSVLLFASFFIIRFMLYPSLFLYFHNKKTKESGFALMMYNVSFPTSIKMKVFKAFYIVLVVSSIILLVASQIILYSIIFF